MAGNNADQQAGRRSTIADLKLAYEPLTPGSYAIKRAIEEIEHLEEKLAQAYQVVGLLAHETGTFDDPAVQRALDYLSGDAFDENFLPWSVSAIEPTEAMVEAARRALMLLPNPITDEMIVRGLSAALAAMKE